jgi:hypothetical protein
MENKFLRTSLRKFTFGLATVIATTTLVGTLSNCKPTKKIAQKTQEEPFLATVAGKSIFLILGMFMKKIPKKTVFTTKKVYVIT